VIQELKLEATPDEIWAQVQRQRAQKAAEDAAAQAAASQTVVTALRRQLGCLWDHAWELRAEAGAEHFFLPGYRHQG